MMRIVIDMQGAQTESRFRGIGRYTMSLSQAIVRHRGEHEIILALSGLFPDTIEPIRAAFDDLLPQENIRVWHAPGHVWEREPGNESRREVAEQIREAFLASLSPDVIHICSLFEGYGDDAVTSIGRFDDSSLVSVTLYDLIPLLNPDHYLKPHPLFAEYYQRKLEYFKRAALYLAISDASRQEGIAHLGLPASRVVNTLIAMDERFQPIQSDDTKSALLCKKFGLTRSFVLCAGGVDERKNLPRLIQSFAALPASLRAGHHLVLAGRMPPEVVIDFNQQAERAGLKSGDLCFTGYITDEELVQLYNLCKLVVFPSWHEGFGLPALEGMACGAPVIAGNTSSLPEVVGLDAALFDPLDVASITAKMAQALHDDAFRAMLREHGLSQAKKFSWDESAKRAIGAWESLQTAAADQYSYLDRSVGHDRVIHAIARHVPAPDPAIVTPLANCLAQNQNSSIERQLLLDVSELSQRDAATGVQRVVRSYLKALLQSPPKDFRVEPVYATQGESYRYARRFTQGFLGRDAENVTDDPIHWQRGDVFFGLDMQHVAQLAHQEFFRRLQSEGVTVKFLIYDLLPIQLANSFKDSGSRELHERWLAMIAGADGANCISKATADAFDRWITENNIGRTPNFQITWVHIGADIHDSKPSMGLPPNAPEALSAIQSRPSFLCVATLEPRKRQDQILGALESLWDEGLDVNLVFVGQQGWKTESLVEKIQRHPEKDRRLFWLQGISDEYLQKVYDVSDCLIAASVNEGFGLPLVEAARHGIPIVARDIPVFREVAGESAFYFTGDAPQELADSLKVWLDLHGKGSHPKSDQLRWLTWQESAERLKSAIFQESYPRRQLLVDISELARYDAKTGIQRVVRSILKEWLNHPPPGYRVEPVYATTEKNYRYARCFTNSFLGYPDGALQDEPIDYSPGDVFLGLDLQPLVVAARRKFYQVLRRQGVRVEFLVYDLLGIQMPQYFPPGNADGFTKWLHVVAESDGAICISKTVANQLAAWVKENGAERQRPFRINWFHIGANIADSLSAERFPPAERAPMANRHTFLMVGTVEPRKAQAQVLQAFESLWHDHYDLNLVIVGKQGWMVERLIDHLRAHSELNNRLFWHDGVSDEYLDKVYATSTCLIAASEGEGFGLPLIEAAQHKIPIIARDIPIFREVGGDCVFYMPKAKSPGALATAIKEWLKLYTTGNHPKSDGMPYLTWSESARNLLDILLGDSPPYKLLPALSKKTGVEPNPQRETLELEDWRLPEPNVPWSFDLQLAEAPASKRNGVRVKNGVRVVSSLSELDQIMRELDAAAAISDDELRRVFTTFAMEFPVDLPADPYSKEYADRQFEVYRYLHGDSYHPNNEVTVFDLQTTAVKPFPFSTESPQTVGNQLIAIGHIIRTLNLPPKSTILEFGPGWGNTTVCLARMGYKVSAIDIEKRFVELIAERSRRKQLDIEIIQGDFSMIHDLERQFDAVLFFECFHHSADHRSLIEGLKKVVAPGGKVVFAAEPITDEFPMPWGFRLDGESLWAIRRHGWCELGFQESYFRDLMGRYGWAISKHVCAETPWGVIFVATRQGE